MAERTQTLREKLLEELDGDKILETYISIDGYIDEILPIIREHAAEVARSIAEPKSDTPDQMDIRYTIFKALKQME